MSDNEKKQFWIVRAVNVFGDLVVLNVIFILFSCLIVTIGASLSALYTVTIRIVKKEDGPVWKGFTEAFKKNFVIATKVWLIVLLMAGLLFGQYVFVINYAGNVASFYLLVIVIELILLLVAIPFVFPYIARYDNDLKTTIKNSFLIGLSNLGGVIKIAVAWIGPIGISIIYPKIFLLTWYLWIICFFAVIAFISSFSVVKAFERIQADNKNK